MLESFFYSSPPPYGTFVVGYLEMKGKGRQGEEIPGGEGGHLPVLGTEEEGDEGLPGKQQEEEGRT